MATSSSDDEDVRAKGRGNGDLFNSSPTRKTVDTSDEDNEADSLDGREVSEKPRAGDYRQGPGLAPGGRASSSSSTSLRDFAESLNWVPMRLTEEERRCLAVLEAALEVSEYTDVVDVTYSHLRTSKQSRIMSSLVDMLSIACGLMMSNNLSKGESILRNKTLDDNLPLFRDLFEIGRRYKIMNPTKMRNTYGKMMYLLMDTKSYQFELKDLNFVKDILTVPRFLSEMRCPAMAEDPLLARAAGVELGVTSVGGLDGVVKKQGKQGGEGDTDSERQKSKSRAEAKQLLEAKYATELLRPEDIDRVVQSVMDNQAYLEFNVGPVEAMLENLKRHFYPHHVPDDKFSLELTSRGRPRSKNTSMWGSSSSYGLAGFSLSYRGDGACLSHDHATQYTFVLQSLTLWSYIMRSMPRLWMDADHDMTHEAYRLADTGQGYQRLQQSPNVRKRMNAILAKVQSTCGPWVGLSVVHLGDRDVPNSLVFIDKYTQVPSILAPIAAAIDRMPSLVADRAFHSYVEKEWGSIDGLIMQILSDFFKHGYDGSGDDGGSCIDGRLTSAWNWCSKLHKKPYYHVFMFCGFQGFDGDWKEGG